MKITRRELRRLIIETVDAAAEWENVHRNPLVQQVGIDLEQVFAAAMPDSKFQFFKSFEDLKGRSARNHGYHELGSLFNVPDKLLSGVRSVLKQTARRNGLTDDDLKMVQKIDLALSRGLIGEVRIGIKV